MEWLPIILSGGGFLVGVAAIITVWVNRRNTKDTVKVDHGANVLDGYSELMDKLQHQVETLSTRSDAMSVTIVRQGEEIESLKIELRDRDDQIRMLSFDRDDLVRLFPGIVPPLRTVG